MNNSRITPKERNLIKGCLRRVFSRSELRALVLERTRLTHTDTTRPRVSKWSYCEACGHIVPSYTIVVDHIQPVVELHQSLESMSLDELANRIWCEASNLQCLDPDCHNIKSKEENRQRREFKKLKKERSK